MRMFVVSAFLLVALVGPLLGEDTILLVDDDFGWNNEVAYTDVLEELGIQAQMWDVSQQGLPSLETLEAHSVVLWVAGRFGTPDYWTQRLLEDFLDADGKLLLGGLHSAQNFQNNWALESAFGVEYEGTTGFGTQVYGPMGSFYEFQTRTDYGEAWTFDVMYAVDTNEPGTQPDRKACATRRSHFGCRTVWLGFSLQDVWPSWEQRDVLEQSLRFLTSGWRPSGRELKFRSLHRAEG